MGPIEINENDIKFVEVIDNSFYLDDYPDVISVLTFEKNDDKNRYDVLHNYEHVDGEFEYCERCGCIYNYKNGDKHYDTCPECGGAHIDIALRNQIDELIYSYLEVGSKVKIVRYSTKEIVELEL